MAMAYIIKPPNYPRRARRLDGKGLPFAATLTVTCLTAGLLSIAMGLASHYPRALAGSS